MGTDIGENQQQVRGVERSQRKLMDEIEKIIGSNFI